VIGQHDLTQTGENMNKPLILAMIVLTAWALPAQAAKPGGKSFPKIIDTPDGSLPEGFTIGNGHTAYNASLDGSIYKFDLRTGKGEVLVEADSISYDCRKLGLRFDPRTNYLFVAGCFYGNAYVYDADTGELIMEYQLDDSGNSVINDLAITRDAVYFTDFAQLFLYRLPLANNGGIPLDPNAATAISLLGDFEDNDCCTLNGIVATPNGKTLIVGYSGALAGNSGAGLIYKVDPTTGNADVITVEPPLQGFLDGIAMRNHTLYIMTPTDPTPVDMIQVVKLDKGMLSGTLVGTIMDLDLDEVASGAIFGNSLYVNNARWSQDPYPNMDDDDMPILPFTPYWVTKLNIHDVE
jgi:WD40 repeat protein